MGGPKSEVKVQMNPLFNETAKYCPVSASSQNIISNANQFTMRNWAKHEVQIPTQTSSKPKGRDSNPGSGQYNNKWILQSFDMDMKTTKIISRHDYFYY